MKNESSAKFRLSEGNDAPKIMSKISNMKTAFTRCRHILKTVKNVIDAKFAKLCIQIISIKKLLQWPETIFLSMQIALSNEINFFLKVLDALLHFRVIHLFVGLVDDVILFSKFKRTPKVDDVSKGESIQKIRSRLQSKRKKRTM